MPKEKHSNHFGEYMPPRRKTNKHAGYFEAVFQLRNPTAEIIAFIKNQLKKRENVWVAKELTVKNGLDIYLSDQRFATALGRRMKKSYPGELKVSRSLFTQSRLASKAVYRVTVLFRSEAQS